MSQNDLRSDKEILEFIMKNLNQNFFFKYLNTENEINNSLNAVVQEEKYETQIEKIGDFFSKVGERYSQQQVIEILKGFSKIQASLFGIELEEERGRRFRDHFIHTFNVYIFGALIISQLMDKIKDKSKIPSFLKIEKERAEIVKAFNLKKEELKDLKPYDIEKRLFFIWTFIAMFHDVGIPIEHLGIMRERLNSFFEKFGFVLHEFTAEFQDSMRTRFNYFIDLLVKMYKLPNNEKGIRFNNDNYETSKDIDPHIKNIFLRALDDKNHGIVSAICFFKCIIDSLSIIGGDNENYREWILEQDITRIALAIALHDLYKYNKITLSTEEISENNIIFPISFNNFPLTFLLILIDQTQEYYRPEGISLDKIIKIKHLPEIKVDNVRENPLEFTIKMIIQYSTPEDTEVIEKIVTDFKNFEIHKTLQSKLSLNEKLSELNKLDSLTSDFEKYIELYWKEVEENINKRLKFGINEPISLNIEIWINNRNLINIPFNE